MSMPALPMPNANTARWNRITSTFCGRFARNPVAFWARLRINVPRFLHLYMDRQFFDPVWLLLLLGLACGTGWTRTRRLALGLLLLLCLSSTITILCFHDRLSLSGRRSAQSSAAPLWRGVQFRKPGEPDLWPWKTGRK
jgi:hypothetical protein